MGSLQLVNLDMHMAIPVLKWGFQSMRYAMGLLIGLLMQCMASVSCGTIHASDPSKFFEQKILPVLVSKCYGCHSQQAKELEGGLRLDSRDAMRHGGDSGPAIVPGNLSQSLLLAALTSKDNPMPPQAPLPAEVIEDFRHWIVSGALDPRDTVTELPYREPDYTEARKYWAFQPVQSPTVPQVQNASWCLSPIDHFVLSRLEAEGLQPAAAAAPEILLRRLTFDLTGLPPTLKQLDQFLADPSEAVYRQMVDALLESPQYGERQAQHWLDVVRYAETEGFEYDRLMPDIWRYRDYVIASFNSDKPYDQFLMEQIAGDELGDNAELKIAAGFHRLGAVRRNAGNQAVASSRNEVLTERTDIIGSAILGLTVGCARCHDHKFDPIPQRDYYRLQAFVAATQEENVSLRSGDERHKLVALKKELDARIDELKVALANLDGEEELRVKTEIKELEARVPPDGPTICTIKNDWQISEPVSVLKRGDPDLPGPQVGMRALGVLIEDNLPELSFDSPHPRTTLARQLIDPRHPLTARVIVNRLWQQHFGNGIVETTNDFGKNGARPSHPELLDYLANRLLKNGWHLKALQREMVTSRVYQQASGVAEATASRVQAVDPKNRWLSHFSRRRLSGEEIRDAMLCISGQLNTSVGGASVVLPVEQQLVDQLYKPSQWEVTQDEQQHHRRSIYLLAKRNLRHPFMEVFDQPSSQTSCGARQQSTHARQALELLNGPIASQLSSALAQRLLREISEANAAHALVQRADTAFHGKQGDHPAAIEAMVRRAYRLVTAREPMAAELKLSETFIREVGIEEFTLAMFNLNAFLYVE